MLHGPGEGLSHMHRRHRSPNTGHYSGVETDRSPTTGAPRWVKMAGIVVTALILLLGYVLLFDGGQHGPSQHVPSGMGPAKQHPLA